MTTVQNLMLSVCFGAVMGTFIANVGFIIKCAIDTRKEKKRKKNEESANKAE
ncbi:hypothetical protein RWV98_06990 [Agathobaculum sp. NTUH-O15-33]|uniref:hypothetical protein n=1 Tax=Agathobaculum sp. NTUH-O15-33 TaxID=3079302 RepID=UPI0029583DB8|nr:hypothetical protein [Agathobaculum sp. NTUH-O15-33]WNX86009.1 hypothetical protein RWV98_06990 [Agathobaculum sp. NTUH-O15-33]